MEENKQHFRHIRLCYFKRGINVKIKIGTVCGEGAVTNRMCQEWFVKFCPGDFSLDDAPWSGVPVEVDSEELMGNEHIH